MAAQKTITVGRDPDAPPKTLQHQQTVASILNSLILSGILVPAPGGGWTLSDEWRNHCGVPGEEGPQGDMGPPGMPGAVGAQGAPGMPGLADEGEPGDMGPPGPAGSVGPQGVQGVPGLADEGEPGDVGPPGPVGATGPQGIQGVPGVGQDGEDGQIVPPYPTMPDQSMSLSQMASNGRPSYNFIINGGFDFWQRYPTATTLTTIAQDGYGPDRWRMCRENAELQAQMVETAGASESGEVAQHYATFKKITNTGKSLVCQPVEGVLCQPLQGRQVIFQCKMKASTNTTMRMGVLYLTSAGSIDVIPAAIVPTTWGATGTDPTFGSNLSLQAPASIPPGAQGTINGNAVDCAVTTSWQQFAVVVTLPTNSKNLLPMLWSNAGMAANDTFSVSEVGLYDGNVLRDWLPRGLADEMMLCQRYYERRGGGTTKAPMMGGYNTATSSIEITLSYTWKRILPTLTKAGTWTTTNCGQPLFDLKTQEDCRFSITATVTGATQVYCADTTTYLEIIAEL